MPHEIDLIGNDFIYILNYKQIYLSESLTVILSTAGDKLTTFISSLCFCTRNDKLHELLQVSDKQMMFTPGKSLKTNTKGKRIETDN